MDEISLPDNRATGLRKVPRRALTISLATTALVIAGGVVVAAAVAASPNGNGSPTLAANGQQVPAPMGRNGAKERMAGPMQALHGEYVVSNGNGGYQTEEMQRGSVTAVNGSTFTVKSDDGYTHDWVTDGNTFYPGNRMRMMPKNNCTEVPAPTQNSVTSSTVTTGQTVMVMGAKDGDTFHAGRVMPMRQGGMERGQNQNGKQEAVPQAGQQQNGTNKVPTPGGRGQFGHRFGGGGGGMQGGQMQGGQMQTPPMQTPPMQSAPMPQDGTQTAPTQSAPSPDQTPAAPDAAPTPTQAS
jgi:hypothetical protein